MDALRGRAGSPSRSTRRCAGAGSPPSESNSSRSPRDRRGGPAVDVHPEQVRGGEHQCVQAGVGELADQYGEGLARAPPRRHPARRCTAGRTGSTARCRCRRAASARDSAVSRRSSRSMGEMCPLCANANPSSQERVGVLGRHRQPRRRPAEVHDAGPAELLPGQLRRTSGRCIADSARGRAAEGVVLRVLPGHAPAVAVHGGECGERLEVLAARAPRRPRSDGGRHSRADDTRGTRSFVTAPAVTSRPRPRIPRPVWSGNSAATLWACAPSGSRKSSS